MREKKRCRWLALLLAVVMVLSVLPTAVFAGEESGNTFYRIFHLDCGRKYFSVEQIKALIDTLAANRYTHMELAVGNDGLRFLLDDMSVTANGTTYTSDDVKAGIQAGNTAYYNDPNGNALTETEMNGIISYAASKSIKIIPLLNTPGHMDAIVDCMEHVGIKNPAYNNSARTVDVTNTAAVNFTLALVNKYIQYFAGKGCTIFNMGCDEYANDIYTTGSMGFGNLVSTDNYDKFVTYVNQLAAKIKDAGMTPMAFNDGIYYNSNTSSGTFDTGIVIAYWTSGFSGYSPAPASFLAEKGHEIINTNDAWYYVLGRNDNSWAGYETAENATKTTAVDGMSVAEVGAMLCVWCDTPGVDYDSNATRVSTLISNLANSNPTYFVADSGETDPTDPGEGTENKTITVTVGQMATATISGANYAGTYTTDDPSIATVEVTGKDAVEPTTTYKQASVYCRTLISDDSDSWIAASNYYYTPDGTNYYPVYAKRSSEGFLFWYTYTYTYTWGYSTTGSTSDVTQIGTQETDSTRTTPNITVYTKSGTEGTPASTTVTFNGLKVGTTYVTVGNTRYTIKVVAEDLSKVTPLTVEYWITNLPVTADGDTSMTIAASDSGVYSESGALFSSLVPATGEQGGNTTVFWKGTRLASDNTQVTNGDDRTGSGTDFTYVRYWNGSWAYSADGKTWTNVATGDQIVAYYLQKTEVTDEITTNVKDWGVVPSTSYNGTDFVLLDFAVKYESGEQTPSSFPVSGKTIAFHCDPDDDSTVHQYNNGSSLIWSNNYRDLGMIMAEETADYEVYMITLTPTNDSNTTQVAENANTATSYTYDGTEKVVWVDDEANLGDFADESLHYTSISGKYTYSVGGTPIIPGIEIFNRHGMLVTYYVRAKVTEDSLSVHYVDDVTKQEFYSYNIAVKSGTLFNENIGLADPWKGNLANGSVTNLQDKTQTVSADLSTMPAIGAQYRYSEYACKSVTRSENGKEVYLYYTFNNTHKFVIDFGLPLNITRENLGIEGNWTSAAVTGAKYGTATATIGDGVTYTPTRVLTEVETLQLTLTDSSDPDGSVTHQIYIYPASNVLYEDNFLTQYQPEGKTYAQWTTGPAKSATGAVQSAVQTTLYGYDVAYVPEAGNVAPSNSMGSAWTIAGLTSGNGSQYLTTSFTGNGFDLIGTAGHNTGYVYVLLKPKDGSTAKLYVVDTSYVDGKQTTLTQVPLLHAEFDTQNTYDVTIRAAFRQGTAAAGSGDTGTQVSRAAAFSMSAAPTSLDSVYDVVDSFFADGFEIDDVEYVYFDDASALAELENSSRATYAMSYALNSASAAATADAEVNTTERPAGTTVTIDGFRVYRSTENSAYSASEHNEYKATYVNVADAALNDGTKVVAFTENGSGEWETVDKYHGDGGPKWEVYLNSSSAIAFKVNTTNPVQISARALGDSAVMKVNGTDITLTSKTEMYYEVTPSGGIVAIQATSGELAIANIKMTGGTQTTAFTEDEITNVVPMLLRMAAAPVEPDPEQPGTEEPAPTPVFTPETFKTRVNSIRTRSKKIVTLTITASTDVDHVVVNGKTYYPMNKLLVKWGLSKTYVFTIMDTAGASETRSFEIVAYNADGLASSTYTDAG